MPQSRKGVPRLGYLIGVPNMREYYYLGSMVGVPFVFVNPHNENTMLDGSKNSTLHIRLSEDNGFSAHFGPPLPEP